MLGSYSYVYVCSTHNVFFFSIYFILIILLQNFDWDGNRSERQTCCFIYGSNIFFVSKICIKFIFRPKLKKVCFPSLTIESVTLSVFKF
jgi:hypothetical protein